MTIAWLNDASELAKYPGYVRSTETSDPVLHENHYYEKIGTYTEETKIELCARITSAFLGALAALSCLFVIPIFFGAWTYAKEHLVLSWTGKTTGDITTIYMRQVSVRLNPQEVFTSENTMGPVSPTRPRSNEVSTPNKPFTPSDYGDYTPYKAPSARTTPNKTNTEDDAKRRIDFSEVDNEKNSISNGPDNSGEELFVSPNLSLTDLSTPETEIAEIANSRATSANKTFETLPKTPTRDQKHTKQSETVNSNGNRLPSNRKINDSTTIARTRPDNTIAIKPEPKITPNSVHTGTPIKSKNQTGKFDDMEAMLQRTNLATEFIEFKNKYETKKLPECSMPYDHYVMYQLELINQKIADNGFAFDISLVEEVMEIVINPADTDTVDSILLRLTDIANQL